MTIIKGKCKRCGGCCLVIDPACAKKNLYRENGNGAFVCRIYDERPEKCRVFPYTTDDNVRAAYSIFNCGLEWHIDGTDELTVEVDGKWKVFKIAKDGKISEKPKKIIQ